MFRKLVHSIPSKINHFACNSPCGLRNRHFSLFSSNTPHTRYEMGMHKHHAITSRFYSSHVLYVVGANTNGSLGLNSKSKVNDIVSIPAKFFKQASGNIVKVNTYGGGTHVAALTDNGELFMWGKNKYGQLGTGDQNSKFAPVRNEFFIKNNLTVKDVACGERHTLVSTTDDRLYSFGYGASSFLGFTSIFGIQLKSDALGYPSKGNQLAPKEIESLRGIKLATLSCGDYHSSVVTEEGDIYIWGRGDWGRLGNGSNKSSQLPLRLQSEQFKEYNTFKKVVTGDTFTIALSKSGTVFTWGKNESSQLGIGEHGVGYITGGSHFDCEKTPQLLPNEKFFEGSRVVDIDCGPVTGAAIDEEGRFYYWGRTLPSPSHIHQIGKAASMSIGKRHGLVLSQDGHVYMIGSYNMLGNNQHIEDITSTIPTNGKIVQIVAGADFSMFLCEE